MAWIWRTQLGKFNVGLLLPDLATTDDHKYVKVKELSLPNKKRPKTEKNWTPFVIYEDQKNKVMIPIYISYICFKTYRF